MQSSRADQQDVFFVPAPAAGFQLFPGNIGDAEDHAFFAQLQDVDVPHADAHQEDGGG